LSAVLKRDDKAYTSLSSEYDSLQVEKNAEISKFSMLKHNFNAISETDINPQSYITTYESSNML